MTFRQGITVALLLAGYGTAVVIGEVKAQGSVPTPTLHRMLVSTGWVCDLEVIYIGDGLMRRSSECRDVARTGEGRARD